MSLKYVAIHVRHKLSKLSNKLLRILQHEPFRSHVPDLYLEFNTLPVTLFHEQQFLIDLPYLKGCNSLLG